MHTHYSIDPDRLCGSKFMDSLCHRSKHIGYTKVVTSPSSDPMYQLGVCANAQVDRKQTSLDRVHLSPLRKLRSDTPDSCLSQNKIDRIATENV